jgi:hypothetical protein
MKDLDGTRGTEILREYAQDDGYFWCGETT